MRDERFSTPKEIGRNFKAKEESSKAGVIVATKGKKVAYTDTSESHILVTGGTGTGKTQCCVKDYVAEVIDKGESALVLDIKGDVCKTIAGKAAKTHRVICIDLSSPFKSPVKYNPLLQIYKDYTSRDLERADQATSALHDFSYALCEDPQSKEQYWCNSGAEFLDGCIYSLMDITADQSEVNIASLQSFIVKGEERRGASTYLKSLYEFLSDNSLAKNNLTTYVNAPNDTRDSIGSVAKTGLSKLTRSQGLVEFLSTTENTLDIATLRPDEKVAIFIIIPDETSAKDVVGGMIVKQIITHYLSLARACGGSLPIRMNVVLEELGSFGFAFSNLPQLLSAGRERNIRIMLVLQSSTGQLNDLYGKSKATTILDNIGIHICFSSNDFAMLKQMSERCGYKTVKNGGTYREEPIISAQQLAQMPKLTALVLNGKYKYINKFPLFYDLYPEYKKFKAPKSKIQKTGQYKIFELDKYVEKCRDERNKALFEKAETNKHDESESSAAEKNGEIDDLFKRLLNQVDNMIAEKELEENEN